MLNISRMTVAKGPDAMAGSIFVCKKTNGKKSAVFIQAETAEHRPRGYPLTQRKQIKYDILNEFIALHNAIILILFILSYAYE